MKRVIPLLLLLFTANTMFSQVSEKELLKKTEETVAKIMEENPTVGTRKEWLLFY